MGFLKKIGKSLKKVVNYQLGLEIFGSKNKSLDDLKVLKTITTVSYTHLTLPTNREV